MRKKESYRDHYFSFCRRRTDCGDIAFVDTRYRRGDRTYSCRLAAVQRIIKARCWSVKIKVIKAPGFLGKILKSVFGFNKD